MAFVVLVRPGRMTGRVLAWCKQLLPAAVLLVAPATFAPTLQPDDDAVVLDADDIDSPMALAHEIARRQPLPPRD
jgi:hypothetical protein